MPVPTTEATTTETETAPKAAKKAAKAKPPKGGKKGPPKTSGRVTKADQWLPKVLKYLKKHPNGESRSKILADLSTDNLGGCLVNNPNLFKEITIEGAKGKAFKLTAAGQKAADAI
mgnify:CR=1 FL=1